MKIIKSVVLLSVLLIGLVGVSNVQSQAVYDNATTYSNVPIVIHVRANDSHPFIHKIFMYQVMGTTIGQPTHGSVEVIGNDIVYYPNLNFQGTDNFIYAYSTDFGVTFIDTASVNVTINTDSDNSFHIRTVGIPPATCTGGKLKVFIKNGVAPYLYQINGSAVITMIGDSIVVPNFVPHVGTLVITDANNTTINTTFEIPSNNCILCFDGPNSGSSTPNMCTGNAAFGLYCGTPPFTAVANNMQGPGQVNFEWVNGTSHSRQAFASNLCQGIYNLIVTDSNNVQVTGSFMIDTNSVMPGNLVSQIDTCIALTNYISANVTDVYTDYLGNTYAEWTIVLSNSQTILLYVHYQIPSSGFYTFVLYVNCNGGKSTVILYSGYNVTNQNLIAAISDFSLFKSISMYPNPVKDLLNVSLNSELENDITINIYNMLGEILNKSNQHIVAGINTFSIDFGSFDNGVYLIQIMDKKYNAINLKVVK